MTCHILGYDSGYHIISNTLFFILKFINRPLVYNNNINRYGTTFKSHLQTLCFLSVAKYHFSHLVAPI